MTAFAESELVIIAAFNMAVHFDQDHHSECRAWVFQVKQRVLPISASLAIAVKDMAHRYNEAYKLPRILRRSKIMARNFIFVAHWLTL